MKEFPITFEYKGKQYSGVLSQVAGGGGASLSFVHRQILPGQLLFVQGKWTFLSQTKEFEELGELFGQHITEHQNAG